MIHLTCIIMVSFFVNWGLCYAKKLEHNEKKFFYDASDGSILLMSDVEYYEKEVKKNNSVMDFYYLEELKKFEMEDGKGKYILFKIMIPKNVRYVTVRVRTIHQQPLIEGYVSKKKDDLYNYGEMGECFKDKRGSTTKTGWENLGFKFRDLNQFEKGCFVVHSNDRSEFFECKFENDNKNNILYFKVYNNFPINYIAVKYYYGENIAEELFGEDIQMGLLYLKSKIEEEKIKAYLKKLEKINF